MQPVIKNHEEEYKEEGDIISELDVLGMPLQVRTNRLNSLVGILAEERRRLDKIVPNGDNTFTHEFSEEEVYQMTPAEISDIMNKIGDKLDKYANR